MRFAYLFLTAALGVVAVPVSTPAGPANEGNRLE